MKNDSTDKVVLKISGGLLLIDPMDILYCLADSSYCWIYTNDGEKIHLGMTLKTLQDMLDWPYFIRVGQSTVVNIHYVRSIHSKSKKLMLNDGTELDYTYKFGSLKENIKNWLCM
ncbi:LytR/AlgR family response regulator transcription factor [Parapedobacter sp. 10938]|uniref:LytR/AlgR family response regulator transcription factor n=1 Tax=Parapedobacter flavus TaxID=3110225 RepID=UPI002DB5FF53|nr:LytTR family DNA-binding domain-containing protein [Parapedobacter sp. 10938]MEC3881793.1 LytTR family DNA-binding domain-containing protein [Parapedobacter sp. 10938]